ncbi:tetraacyldisaccharide 4'-kinase [Microbulbifer thermotolerans]|uniref:Tetraacyldisaccharide 4'-kinase n=1 Tax=Microbulbifer thermotolerans TaxID=252514 RepID=A0AB35HVJ2_MICTH|nr:tetraacyldisaccharide 4'-kinase [Microbulbifer thermotolerans]MCX2800463.1 tetraacyldisaccharide 4'-kinase [Microbulbifer thermotolerans]
MSLENWFNRRWYPQGGEGNSLPLLAPLEHLYRQVSARRRRAELAEPPAPLSVPVIVVGNITTGGAGKTPLVAELGRWLRERGWNPGIISRGYGGRAKRYPYQVTAQSHPLESGDEPLMLHLITGLPVMVSPNRTEAAQALIDYHQCNVILSDDGLQHYKLWRSLEICVVDGQRGLGNGRMLPRGPLREPPERLREVDLVVSNGEAAEHVREQCGELLAFSMQLQPAAWHQFNLDQISQLKLASGPGPGPVYGVAAIGNPQRFFHELRQMGYQVMERPFPDHHQFSPQELQFDGVTPVIMTMKDAVKCRDFWQSHWWALEVSARLPDLFYQKFHQHLKQFSEDDQ